MKAIKVILLTLIMISCANKDELAIRTAIENQLSEYPDSELRDLYKNFFQDFYGPGHLIEDKSAAIQYLDGELEKTHNYSLISHVEYTGYKKNFVRVDLYLVKAGIIPKETFLNAFFESAEGFQLPEINEWAQEWNRILKEIEKSYPDISNLAGDKIFLQELLENGRYVVHHSENYIKKYNPHYRIVSRDSYNKYLKVFLTESRINKP